MRNRLVPEMHAGVPDACPVASARVTCLSHTSPTLLYSYPSYRVYNGSPSFYYVIIYSKWCSTLKGWR